MKSHPAQKNKISVKKGSDPSGPSRTLSYPPAFDLDFVERLLGRRQRRDLPKSTRQRLQIQQDRLQNFIRPRLVWRELPIDHISKTAVTLSGGIKLQSRKMARAMQGAKHLVGFIATVGNGIDLEIDRLMDEGELANGYIADALGSGAVESLADRFHSDMAKFLAAKNQAVGLRFSPGYCDWEVAEQHTLFSLLDNEEVGVILANTSLMAPRKSISGVFGIFAEDNAPVRNKNHNPCHGCGKKDCIARRIEANPPSHHQ